MFDLQDEFPNQPVGPNILYLVSSALPYFPVRMAKLAKESGARLVINQNGVAYPGWFGKGWRKQNRPMKELLEMADHVLYQSHFCKVSADKFLGTRHSEYDILYNPVNTEHFRPADLSNLPKDRITLLLAGSHWSLYRPKAALQVLQRVRQFNDQVYLKIAGRFCWEKDSARAAKQVQDLAVSLGVEDRVCFSGAYSQKRALELLQECSILLHTKYNDPCPRLVIEAMACGLPIVYSATGGVPELVGKEAGIGVSGPLDWEQDHPPDPDAMAEAVLQIITSHIKYSTAARKRAVERFDVKPWVKRHKEIFEYLISSEYQVSKK